MDDNELYFDNQDDLDLEDQLLGSDDDADSGESQTNRGDLNIALKKEREEKKRLKEENDQLRREYERREALLANLAQRRDEPQVDRNALRQSLADSLIERPDEVFQQRDQHLLSRVQQQLAPVYIKAAKSDVSEDPEYGELYKSRPAFKKTVDAYIQNTVNTNGQVDPDSLKETLSFLAAIATEGQGAKPSTDAAKQKLTSIADKGSSGAGRKTVNEILDEKLQLAKTNRKAYIQWADSPEGKQVLNKALQSGLI